MRTQSSRRARRRPPPPDPAPPRPCPMTTSAITAAATELIYREGLYLDRQEWELWLQLYREDAVFWVPAWKSEHQQIEDPDREVSLIYHGSRVSLEERVARV